MDRNWQGITLPDGVYVNASNGRTPKVNIRFTLPCGTACRELSLPVGEERGKDGNFTKAALKTTTDSFEKASTKFQRILGLLDLGKFNYAEEFPKSKKAVKLGHRPPPETVNIGEVLDAYLAEIAKPTSKACKVQTVDDYKSHLNFHIRKEWGHRTCDTLTEKNLTDWLRKLRDQKIVIRKIEQPTRTMKASTARRILTPFINAIDLAGIFDENPVRKIDVQKIWGGTDDDNIVPFTEEERAKILAACPSDQWRRMMTFWWWTGLRIGELFALTWDKVDWKRELFHVTHTFVDGVLKEDTKTKGSRREVPLMFPALKVLREQQIARTQAPHTHNHVWGNERTGNPVFRGALGLQNVWKTILKRAGVKFRNPYQNRHTFASHMLERGERPIVIAQIMGHTNARMVYERYGKMIKTTTTAHGFPLRSNYGDAA